VSNRHGSLRRDAQNIASVIDTDAYFPNDQTSNGEAKGIEDEGKIKMMKARSNKRAANRGKYRLAIAHMPTQSMATVLHFRACADEDSIDPAETEETQ
jgi:hypothetical protein